MFIRKLLLLYLEVQGVPRIMTVARSLKKVGFVQFDFISDIQSSTYFDKYMILERITTTFA